MKSQYTIEKKENYLLMTITGQYAIEDFMSFPSTILEHCEKENITKVLVDALNLTGTNVPTMERFFIGENIAMFLGPKISLAVVWHIEHIDKFAENVAVNRGGRLFVTDSFEEAEKWLLNDAE